MTVPNPIQWLTDEKISRLQRFVRFQLLIELGMLLVWISLFITFEVWTSPNMDAARLSLLLSLLGHLGTPLALISLNHGLGKHVGWERWFLMFGNLFTDVWSALDAWLHLEAKGVVPDALAICRTFTTMALVTSSVAVIVYLYALLRQSTTTPHGEVAAIFEQLLPPRSTRVRPIHK
jgi:hypothetical protein